jgi:hypothetical protein
VTRSTGLTYFCCFRVFAFIGLLGLGVASSAYASPDAIGCTEELALPGYLGLVAVHIPAKVEVRVAIGKDGKARSTSYSTPIAAFRQELDEYFAEKTRYSTACAGKTISFLAVYKVEGSATAFAQAEVRFIPPDQIVIICHPKAPALDPAR